MKHLNNINTHNYTLASICAISLLLTACSEIGAKSEKLSDAQACSNLNDLISDHSNQFKNSRKNFTGIKRMSIWSAEKVFPTAETCQIWEWSTGLFNYVCQWDTGNDEGKAVSNYQDGMQIIQSCLGDSWIAQPHDTQSGGKHTLYTTPNKATIVSIRYFKEQKGWSPSWQNTVVVGDKNNLNAPTQ